METIASTVKSGHSVNGIKTDVTIRRFTWIATWFVVLLIPTYGKVTTSNMTEKTFFWPWMILIRFKPTENFQSDQYTVVAFPWSILLFIPFLYVLKLSWELSKSSDERVLKSTYIVLISLIQIGLIAITYSSQDPTISEDKSVWYIPQIILIILHAILAGIWFSEESRISLERGRAKRENEEITEEG